MACHGVAGEERRGVAGAHLLRYDAFACHRMPQQDRGAVLAAPEHAHALVLAVGEPRSRRVRGLQERHGRAALDESGVHTTAARRASGTWRGVEGLDLLECFADWVHRPPGSPESK
eukprot:scaffold33656_cov54-Phaeocystis_antarctica.AAC.2